MLTADCLILQTFALQQVIAAEWDETHPNACNCERCEWRWSKVFRAALKSIRETEGHL